MKSPLSVAGNGIHLALRPFRQIRNVFLKQKVKHPRVKAFIPCTSGKVISKGSMKAVVLFTMTDLFVDIAFETSDAGPDCDGSKTPLPNISSVPNHQH